jgi:hypothetical protein
MRPSAIAKHVGTTFKRTGLHPIHERLDVIEEPLAKEVAPAHRLRIPVPVPPERPRQIALSEPAPDII